MIPFKRNSVLLAPMAGITDRGFRKICISYGADGTFSEMVSAKGIYYKDKKSYKLLEYSQDEQPISLQIFGSDIESIKVACQYINQNYSPASIDINMGCPAPKIFQNGDGCALMKNISLAQKIIIAAKENSSLPISVKFRAGVDEKNINAVDFAIMCEDSGADFITVHGRTREQFYSGCSDKEIIKKVVDSVNIPVIANGDVTDGQSAKELLDYTRAHCVMVGRGALGNPQIFAQIKSFINDKPIVFEDKLSLALLHLSYTIEDKGEILAVKEFRKHLMWYLKGYKNSAKLKQLSSFVNTYDDCKKVIDLAMMQNVE